MNKVSEEEEIILYLIQKVPNSC